LLEVVCTPVVVLPVFLNVWAVFAGLFPLEVIWMLLVPLLLEVILRDLSVSVHTVAAWRSVEDLAAAFCTSMVTPTGLVVEANTGRGLLLEGCGAGSLYVSGIAKHGHLYANFRNAMRVFVVVYRAGTRAKGGSRAATLGRLVFWRELAKAGSLGL
jgi:hypothetical protein